MRLNSQPSHLHARGVVIRVRRGDGVSVGSTSRVRRAGTPSCQQDVETRPDTSMRRHRGRGNAYIVSFLPGMTTSQFSRSVDPSALLRGRATKPMGWSLRQLRRSSRRRPSAMPAIFFAEFALVRRGLRGAVFVPVASGNGLRAPRSLHS